MLSDLTNNNKGQQSSTESRFLFNPLILNEFLNLSPSNCEATDKEAESQCSDNSNQAKASKDSPHLYFQELKSSYPSYKQTFLEKTKSQFSNNPSIKRSKLRSRVITQNNIDFSIEFLTVDNLTKKPLSLAATQNSDAKRPRDVFEPPFEEGLLLDDNFMNLGNHRILYNKFPIKDNHVVMVSKEFKSQYTHLNLSEISELIMLESFINGIVFFNGGKKSGASQPRKHIQSIPLENISKDEFGIFKIFRQSKNEFFGKVEIENFSFEKADGQSLNRDDNSKNTWSPKDYDITKFFEVLKIRKFEENSISHLFVDLTKMPKYFNKENFEDILTDHIEEYAKIVFCIYLNVLKNLNLINSNFSSCSNAEISANDFDGKERIFSDYSLLYTKDWLYVIPRQTDCVEMKNGNLYLNSNSYTFSLLIKSEELEKEIEEVDIIKDIYTKL